MNNFCQCKSIDDSADDVAVVVSCIQFGIRYNNRMLQLNMNSSEKFVWARVSAPFFRLSSHVNEKKIDYIIFVLLNIVADTLAIYFPSY